MTESPEPTAEDGPLFREAQRRAEDVDRAEVPAERRRAWARFLPSAVVALAEGFLRDSLVTGTVLFSIVVLVMGVTSGEVVWAIGGVVAGVGGAFLVLRAVARHWPFGRQWAAILGVLVLQCVLMVAFWTAR